MLGGWKEKDLTPTRLEGPPWLLQAPSATTMLSSPCPSPGQLRSVKWAGSTSPACCPMPGAERGAPGKQIGPLQGQTDRGTGMNRQMTDRLMMELDKQTNGE